MPVIEGGFGLTGTDSARRITLNTETALTIFDNVAVMQRDQYARALGLYSEVTMGRDLYARFASFSTPKHLLSARKNGCTWYPKGGTRLGLERFPTCPVEYDGEQCPDAFYGTCFERFFGPGNGVRSFSSTPEAQALLAQMMRKIYQGLGNSFFDLYNFANHPLIDQANVENFWNKKVGVDEWEDYLDQMMSGDCGGLITQLDELKARGVDGYTMDIPNSDITEATGKYTGNFGDLVEELIEQASPELRTMIDSGQEINGRVLYPVILATTAEFNKYKADLKALHGTNELAYRFYLEGSDGTTKLMRNVLVYDNMPVIRWDAHVPFDAITGAQSHRVAIVAPGVFGVLHDVADLNQFEGMGLMVEQSTRLQDKGKIFFSTTFRWGAAVADTRYISMASNILHP